MERVHMELPPAVEQWARLSAGIREFCERHGLADSMQSDLQLACEEWFMNVVIHGYLEGGMDPAAAEPITAELWLHEEREAVARFTDAARSFNPLDHHTPDVSLDAEERPIGGLGIYLIRQKMDDCAYERTEGRNQFTMRIKIRSV